MLVMNMGSGAVAVGQVREHPWRALVEGVARGEQRAFARLYDESSNLVYGVVMKILANEADAEEVSLDVYLQVWRQAASYTAERGSPMAWLVTLARSRALDRLRSQATRRAKESAYEPSIEPADTSPPPDEASWVLQQRDRIRKVLDELGPEQRTVIELAYYEGLSHADLAERLKLPLGTIKTRIRLAMGKLREQLGGVSEVAL